MLRGVGLVSGTARDRAILSRGIRIAAGQRRPGALSVVAMGIALFLRRSRLRPLLLLGLLWCAAAPGGNAELPGADLPGAERPGAALSSANLPNPADMDRWQAEVRTWVTDLTADPAWQARMDTAREQVSRALDLPVATSGDVPGAGAAPGDRLYLFVSSSLPAATLRRYALDLARLGTATASGQDAPAPAIAASMVLRGFIGGGSRMGPTLRFVHTALRLDPACDRPDCAVRAVDVQVDPLLFRRYGIERVPALVYATGWQASGMCSEGTERGATVGSTQVVYGDANLGYLLERLAETHALPGAAALARRLQQPNLEDQPL